MLHRGWSRSGSAIHAVVTIASLAASAGGPSKSVTALCSAMAEAGASVTLLTLDTQRGTGSPVVLPDHRVTTRFVTAPSFCRIRVKWSPHLARELRQIHGASTEVITHDNGLWLPFNHTACAVARRRSVPLVISPRGMLEPWSFNHKAWKKRLAWWGYQRRDLAAAQVLHATSSREAANLRALRLRQPVAVVPNGVDIPLLKNWEENDGDSGVRTVCFLGRIYPVKGLLNLVQAWHAIKRAGWRCVIAGPNEAGHQQEVMSALRARGLEGQFEFTGMVDDVEKWNLLSRSDLFVLPSFTENFGLAIAEALAAGVPVITTKGTPWEELITHRCGWWVDIGVEPLAAALREAMALSRGERREMGQRGRRLVEENYSWPRIAREMLSVYEWVLGKGERPGCVV